MNKNRRLAYKAGRRFFLCFNIVIDIRFVHIENR